MLEYLNAINITLLLHY